MKTNRNLIQIWLLTLLAGVHQAAAQPVVSFTHPTNGQQIVTFSGLAGTAQTSTGTIQQVTFSIYNQSTGQWWDGTNYQGVLVSLPASLSGTNWIPASGLALPHPCCGQYYQLTASATDTHTNTGTTNIIVQADSIPPVVTFSPLANGQTVSNLSTIGGSVTDNFNLVASVVFSIHEQDINGGSGRWWNGTNFQNSLVTLPTAVSGTSWSNAPGVVLPQLNSGQSYDLTVIATDTTSNSASATITVTNFMTVLTWDPGTNAQGTMILQNPNNNGGNYWFSIQTQTPAIGVWRTALNVLAGSAGVYMTQGWPENTNNNSFASANPGSNGFVLDAKQFNAGQTWYILVNATANAQWNLVTGDAFAYDLGTLAVDASSSTNASIGAEGMIFYKTTVPTNTLAWQLWINGLSNTIYVKKAYAPDPPSHDLIQAGQMLIVPPYLAAGIFNGEYFIGIPGNPGTAIPLDSRQQPFTEIPFNSLTNVVVTATNFPYVTFQVQVPVQQIAWQLNLTPTNGDPDIAVRRDTVPNEFRNDAFSETPGGGIGASVTLVPPPAGSGSGVPGLSDGTWYVTVYSSGPYSCVFTNGNPVITDVACVFCVTNDETNRVGWRYYRTLDIDVQLTNLLWGWVLDLANQVPGTEIAIRRNAVPGEWDLRNQDDSYNTGSEGYIDFSSTSGELVQIGHPADVWYIGVYMPMQALGSFVLCGNPYEPPPPQPPITNCIPITNWTAIMFDSSSNSVSVINQPPGRLPCHGRYFKVEVPSDTMGWDVRLINVTGNPQMVVCRDTLPPNLGTEIWYTCSDPFPPWCYTFWPSTWQWQAGMDWTGDSLNADGTHADVSTLAMGVGNPLQAGSTYYIGVCDPNYTNSYTLLSRGIGTNYSIPVYNLDYVGSTNGSNLPPCEADCYPLHSPCATVHYTNLPPREAVYYKVVVPTNAPSWRVRLAPTVGDALLVVQQNYLPNVVSGGSAVYEVCGSVCDWEWCSDVSGGFKAQKEGHQHYLLLPQPGETNIPAGTYYLGVVSEGINPHYGNGRIGTDTSSYALYSTGPLLVNNLGTATNNDLLITNCLEGGDVAAYQFTMPPGLESATNRVQLSVVLTDLTGNAQYWMEEGTNVPAPWFGYGVDGGDYYSWEGGANVLVNPDPGVYTLSVQSYPSDTSYILRVHLEILGPTPIEFDGPGNSVSVTNQAPGQWSFFQVVTNNTYYLGDTNLLGWDVRLTNVTGDPQMVVCRDILPVYLGTSWSPEYSTNWPSTYQWQGGMDWTGDSLNPDGTAADISTLVMGVGNPLQTGTYYIGVYDPNYTSSYTLVSRGIAFTKYSIPVYTLGFVGTNTGTNLPPREAAYYQVVVTNNTPSWRVRLAPTAGDALLVVQQQYLPNIISGSSAVYPTFPNGGFKAQKVGNEHYLLLPENGQSTIPAGTYYLGVVSEGVNTNYGNGEIGSNTTSYAISSLGPLPVVCLGIANPTYDLLVTNSLEGGDVAAYKFTMAPGFESATNRVKLSVVLTDLIGNAQYWMEEGTNVPAPQFAYGVEFGYGVDGGDYYNWEGGANVLVNPEPGVYTLSIQSYPSDTSYILRVHLEILGPTPIAFDGPSNSVSVINQPPGQWNFFQVVTNNTYYLGDPILLGWDVRLINVTAGAPQMVVCRDKVPVNLGTSSWGPEYSTNWPSTYQWQGRMDWTGDSLNPDGTAADISTLAMGVGNPLQAGTYYIGVYDPSHTSSYTLVSRGIAFTNYSIPVYRLNFVGTNTGTNLPAREAAYYQVVVTNNTPSWRVRLAPTAGDALLVVQQQYLPNIISGCSAVYSTCGGFPNGGFKAQKVGNEHYLLLPQTGQSTIPAGTYYVGVVSEGVNPDDSNGKIGSDTTSYVLSSGSLPVTDLGTVGTNDLLVTNIMLESEDVAAYHFVFPSNIMGMEVRLENRVGNPVMTLLEPDTGIATPYVDGYRVEGGQGWHWNSPNLITIPNPPATNYSLVVKALRDSGYVDAAYDLRVREIVPAPLNANGGTNIGTLADTESAFFQVVIPTNLNDAPVLGWELNLSQTNGSPSVRVRQNLLPDNTCDTTAFASGSIIIAPPFLVPGTWYVEVKGSGNTAFSLASSLITTNNTLQRAPWTMPMIGQPDTSPGLSQPVFGDTGVDSNGTNLFGDQGVDLAQGHYDFYAVIVPTNNAGLLHAELLAISGNPQLYIRAGAAPTPNHYAEGSCDSWDGQLIDHQLIGRTTQYGSWVPLNGRIDTQLTPGIWVISVYAAGNANVRYRLILSSGNSATNGLVQDLPLDGSVTLMNQGLAGGNWRYYRVQIPTNAPNNLLVTWTNTVGSPQLFIRDTVPPGDDGFISWSSDKKNEGPYPDHISPGSFTLTTPPLRTGTSYYFGIWSPDDTVFSITCSTNGGAINVDGVLDFYNGSLNNVIINGYSTLLYRIDVPPEATSLQFSASNSSNLVLFLEQGTVPGLDDDAQWISYQANASLTESLTDPSNWPWLPGYSYYLAITNTSAIAESFSLVSDGLSLPPQFLSGTGFDATGCAGGPFIVTNGTFSLTNIGTAPLNWSLANTSLWIDASSTNGTLAVGGSTNVTVSLSSNAYSLTSGIYTATVWFTNLNDVVGQSRQFTLVVGPPVITTEPADQAVSIGDSATFSVSAVGATPLSYFWRRNGTNIAGANTSSYTINNVQRTNSGSLFNCVVSNGCGTATSSNALLTVLPSDLAPVSVVAPSTGVIAGQSVPVVCVVTNQGSGSASGYWYDGIYFSSNFVFGPDAINLIEVGRNHTVAAGSSYRWTNSVALPQVPAGTYYLFVVVDDPAYGYPVYESTKNNNTNAAVPITVLWWLCPPVITPTNSVWGGETLTLSENCLGSLPLAYQWQTDGGGGGALNNIPPGADGVTGDNTNKIIVVTSTNIGSYKYRVVITNSYGSATSDVVAYVVRGLTAPFITQDIGTLENGPVTNIFAFIGGSVNFYAAFDGPPVVTNQWSFGTTGIDGATSNLYRLNNVQDPASVGLYQYHATNAYGSSNSTPAHLTALADPGAPTNIGTNAYSYCVYTNHPWAYWKFEETNDTVNQSMQAYDYSGNNFDATYGTNTTDGQETIDYVGIHGPRGYFGENSHYAGFPLTNGCAGLGGDVTSPLPNGYISVPPLNLNTNTVTFTMWIHPKAAALPPSAGLLMNRNGNDGAGVGFGAETTTNALGTPCLTYTWNSNSAATYGWNTGLYPIPQIWSFVACVVTPTNTSMYMYYINGASTNLLKSVFAITNNPEAFGGIAATRLGGDSGGGDGRTFAGAMDEVAVFTNSMSENQIQDLFLKALGGLTGLAPSITTQPANTTTLYAGTTLQLSVVAGGIPNPTYQWQYSADKGATWTSFADDAGIGVSGATSNILTITGFPAISWVARTNFQLIVTNNYGSVTSSLANIIVLRIPGNSNGLWTVNFAITTTNGGGLGTPFNGRGVLGMGSYWNALGTNGASQVTNTTTLWDDGATVSGINFQSQAGVNVGVTSSLYRGVPTNNLLLDTYATFSSVTPTPLVFSPIPNGRYNLALYGCVGNWLNRATKFTVFTNGVSAGSKGLTNLQDSAFVAGDNLAVFTNLLVMNQHLEVDIVFLPCPLNTNTASGEADFNGAQLQLIKYAPAITNFNPLTRTLSWQGGILSSATNIMGPWQTNSFTSPFTMNPTGHMQFFRIYNPTF